MTNTIVAPAELCKEIAATFDDMVAWPVQDRRTGFEVDGSVRIAGEGHMPDGLPIFCTHASGGDEYNGTVHVGFERWLAERGYGWERWDACSYIAIPKMAADARP